MFARTPRLLLRPGWPEDALALHAAIGGPGVIDMLSRAPSPYLLADAEAFVARTAVPAALPELLILAREADATALVGAIGLLRDPDGEIELGYWITPSAWGRGYATEAGHAMLAIAAAIGVTHLTAGHFVDNPGSGRVLAKLGFARTGRVAARFSRARGRLVPTALYARDAPGAAALAA